LVIHPGDDPRTKDELEKAAKHIIDNNYHPNHMGIQFVQIGNDAGADLALKALTQANANVRLFIPPNSLLFYFLPFSATQLSLIYYYRTWLTRSRTQERLPQKSCKGFFLVGFIQMFVPRTIRKAALVTGISSAKVIPPNYADVLKFVPLSLVEMNFGGKSGPCLAFH
jgi:hypothetical protein